MMDWDKILEAAEIIKKSDTSIQIDKQRDWQQKRLGKITSSKLRDLMAKGKKKDEEWGQTAITYMLDTLAERLTGEYVETFSKAMNHGTEHEEEAFNAYLEKSGEKMAYGNESEDILFCEGERLKGFGGSPDGIGKKGICEIKCPYNSTNHLKYMALKEINEKFEHWHQIQGNMLATGTNWCDFVSYDPRMPDDKKIHIIRVPRSGYYIQILIKRIKEALLLLDKEDINKIININLNNKK